MLVDESKRRRGLAKLVFAAAAILFILLVDWVISDLAELLVRQLVFQVLLTTLWAVPFFHGFSLVALSTPSTSAVRDVCRIGVVIICGASCTSVLAISVYKIILGKNLIGPDPVFIVDLLCSVSMALLAVSYASGARIGSGERAIAVLGTMILIVIAGLKSVRLLMHVMNFPNRIWTPTMHDVEGPMWSTFFVGQLLLSPAFVFELFCRVRAPFKSRRSA